MSPPSPPKTDAIPKPLPTIPFPYKIPCKCPCPSPSTFEWPTKKGRNILSLLHGLTKEPCQFHPQKTLLPIPKADDMEYDIPNIYLLSVCRSGGGKSQAYSNFFGNSLK
uniref:Uncharacterized protein n=1 Tax=Romanomermis culicivorax TaxID=13658 RepID=A0A915L6Q5_ROMCU